MSVRPTATIRGLAHCVTDSLEREAWMQAPEPDRTFRVDDEAARYSGGRPSVDQPGAERSSETNISREPARTLRGLGAAYLVAQVRQDVDALSDLHDRHEPKILLASLATACRSLVAHIASVEGTTPRVVADAYSDAWQQPS